MIAAAVLVASVGMVPAATAAPTPGSGPSYWLFAGDGGVFPFGRGAYAGGMAASARNAPIVGGAVTPDGVGYWEASADGGVFSFGSARYAGSLSGRPHAPIVGIASPGSGYWLAASDGGVFAFGGAPYYGSAAGFRHAPIVAIVATPGGYWLVASDGGVFAYGAARYFGSGAAQLHAPIVGLASSGNGYWLVASDGGVFTFGGAPYYGSAAAFRHAPIVGVAPFPGGGGYWLVASDGGVFSFGAARFFGSVGAARLNRGIVGIASGDGVNVPRAPNAPFSTAGFDISWPQCGGIRPAPPYGFGIVGVTGGQLFTANPCLAEEWSWARTYGSFAAPYLNTNAPDAAAWLGFTTLGPGRRCGVDAGCVLDLWGRLGVRQALRDAQGIDAPMWWLDVETGNEWTPDTAANAVVLRAMIDELTKAGRKVGIYSTNYQWTKIAGGYAPGLPTWVPGAPADSPASYCAAHSFGNGPTWMTQSGDANFDTDVLCAAGLSAYEVAFAAPKPLDVPTYTAPAPPPPAKFSGPPPSRPVARPVTVAAPRTAPLPLPRPSHHSSWTAGVMLVLLAVLVVEGLLVSARGVARHRDAP